MQTTRIMSADCQCSRNRIKDYYLITDYKEYLKDKCPDPDNRLNIETAINHRAKRVVLLRSLKAITSKSTTSQHPRTRHLHTPDKDTGHVKVPKVDYPLTKNGSEQTTPLDLRVESKKQAEGAPNKASNRFNKGSGVVFRANGLFYLQTSDHVSRGVINLSVNFFYDDGENEQFESVKNRLIYRCHAQDKAIYQLYAVPDQLQGPEIPDVGPLVVSVADLTGFIEYYKDDKRGEYSVHVCNSSTYTIEKCQVIFSDESKDNCYTIESCSPESDCYRIFLNEQNVPESTKMLFMQPMPWETLTDPFVAIISHPHGKLKKISFGKPQKVGSIQRFLPEQKRTYDRVMFVQHDAYTCKGSSGGCMILIGQDTTCHLGYRSYMGMHYSRLTNSEYKLSSIGLVY